MAKKYKRLTPKKMAERKAYMLQRIREGAKSYELMLECKERWGATLHYSMISKYRREAADTPKKEQPKVEVLVVQEGIQAIVARLVDAMVHEGVTQLSVSADGEYSYTRKGRI